jgi:putative transposase
VILGFCTLLVSPRRLGKIALLLKTSTLLRLHRALVRRKYRLLYSSKRCGRPGPKGPSRELIDAVVEMKRRNPYFGCRKIAEQIPCRSSKLDPQGFVGDLERVALGCIDDNAGR